MPIKAIQNSYKPGRGMEQIGRIFKGAARTEEDIAKKRPGKDLPYFRVEFNATRAAYAAVFAEMYGANPAELWGAVLIGQTVEDVLDSWFEEWRASGLFHRCDGETQKDWFNPAIGGLEKHNPIPCVRDEGGCQCKQIGRINLWLPEFTYRTGILGYFTLSTHSIRDIGNLNAVLTDLHAIRRKLAGVPMTLGREEVSWDRPELDKQTKQPTGRRIKITKSLLTFRPDERFVQLMGQEQGAALPAPAPMKALPAPEGDGWTEAQAMAWAQAASRDTGAGTKDLLAALGVARLSDWQGDAVSASYRLSQYIEEEIERSKNNPLMG